MRDSREVGAAGGRSPLNFPATTTPTALARCAGRKQPLRNAAATAGRCSGGGRPGPLRLRGASEARNGGHRRESWPVGASGAAMARGLRRIWAGGRRGLSGIALQHRAAANVGARHLAHVEAREDEPHHRTPAVGAPGAQREDAAGAREGLGVDQRDAALAAEAAGRQVHDASRHSHSAGRRYFWAVVGASSGPLTESQWSSHSRVVIVGFCASRLPRRTRADSRIRSRSAASACVFVPRKCLERGFFASC